MSAYFPRIDERGRWFGTSEDLGFDVYAWDPHEDGKVKKYPDDYITTGAYDTDKKLGSGTSAGILPSLRKEAADVLAEGDNL